ncbi:hypothetical protein C900_03013 [Fulvivirga imtechensis AK7]|uniref:Activator of Hsp90 ATPase homologue 1/2-like C-terminal domain-containing protein n=1 Tax=Fulvivirga imtechensis AK7 TaxID=1237149 RepID=L8JUH9_9BACT|nr:SRPBCC domain-containing protein [Fulvivirga imtechensis]ELR71209.1 hypothetical protein C900_03013 [Fulvivirga imtechensis AK7]
MKKQTLKLSIDIAAPKQKVWDVLLQDETYRLWTSVFHPGSYAEGGWDEGSRVYFKGPEGDGLVSRVLVHKPNDTISFEHLNVLVKGKENRDHPEAAKWKGLTETYYVTEQPGGTHLAIAQDITPEYAEHFNDTWQKALKKVKELAER